jgi:hypothetical protein
LRTLNPDGGIPAAQLPYIVESARCGDTAGRRIRGRARARPLSYTITIAVTQSADHWIGTADEARIGVSGSGRVGD